VELAFDGECCLDVSFCVEIYASGVVVVMVLISCAPIVGVLSFFFPPPGALAVFFREGYAGYVTPCGALVVVPISSFLPSVRGLEFLLFDGGSGALLQSW
jgi:hypothetical protein